ncbi:MAG: hypothetical protein HOY71_40780 [Nonomuraea sp.]|nr:hypothetical protein [Nonomuraea sp.]
MKRLTIVATTVCALAPAAPAAAQPPSPACRTAGAPCPAAAVGTARGLVRTPTLWWPVTPGRVGEGPVGWRVAPEKGATSPTADGGTAARTVGGGTAARTGEGGAVAAGGEPGWRVAVAGQTQGFGGFQDVGSTGPGHAWVTRVGMSLLRWNGRAWRAAGGAAVPYLVTTVGTREAWQFVETPGKLDARHYEAGAGWHAHPIAAEAHATAAVATAPGDCWVAALKFGPRGMADVVWHWAGGRWQQVSTPAPITDLAANGRNDVWALSSLAPDGGARVPSIMHWTGHGWRTTAVRGLTTPADSYTELDDVLATGRKEAYAVGAIVASKGGLREGVVLRWNGTEWNRVDQHPAGIGFTRVARDGTGGLWLATRRQGGSDVLTHYARGGWGELAVQPPMGTTNVEVRGLANVPGTTAMWATAQAGGSDVTRQLILSYR